MTDHPHSEGSGVGVLLTAGPVPPEEWHEFGAAFAELERLGADTIWIADHLFWGTPIPEAMTTVALALASTTRCKVGPGVLQVPLRRTASVAKQAASLQVFSNGRFVLGVGVGEHEPEYSRAGVEHSRRGALLDEALVELDSIWAGGDGRFEQRPVPSPIPVWVGGRSPAALERAATHGSGWLPMFCRPSTWDRCAADLDERLERAGRSGDRFDKGICIIASVDRPGWSRDQALAWMSHLWDTPIDVLAPHLTSGSGGDIGAVVKRYRDAGATHVCLLPADPRPVEMLAEVAPFV